MKKRLSQDNPFRDQIRWAYGYEFIADGMRLLDYGCHTAGFIRTLAQYKKVEAYGVDKDKDVVAELKLPNVSHVDRVLPFPDATFDVVTLFDVLEHVYDQHAVLAEINRVLKARGTVIVCSPRRYLFSFLDHGNFKYRFPRIHKIWYTRRHSPAEYEYRYVSNPSGLIGDVDKEKAWHQHFREPELRSLLQEAGFEVTDFDGAGLFGDLINFLGFFGLGFLFVKKLRDWENYRFSKRYVFCAATKQLIFEPT